nr:MAG TPA_asm: tail collar fiber protein [Caudoviricetes sp.]
MPTTDGYNGAYTGPEIDKGIARANQAVTVPGSGTASMSETLGSGPYTIEFTEEADPQDVSASKITYDNTESGMTATNVQDAITELSTAPKGGAGVPVGSVFWLAAQTAPEGYLICDGSAVSRTEYADLFAAIGTTFGTGDGSTTFALPNLQAAFIRGAGSQDGYSATFGQKQEATSIGSVILQGRDVSVHNYDKSANATSNIGNASSGTSLTFGYYSVRPYNIALTPIIKY